MTAVFCSCVNKYWMILKQWKCMWEMYCIFAISLQSFDIRAVMLFLVWLDFCACLVVISAAHYFLAGRPEQDGVLVLGSVAALDVTERWVWVYDAKVTQILQCHQVLALTQAVQPAAAECQCAKILIDHIQQMFSPWKPATQWQQSEMRQVWQLEYSLDILQA